MLNSRSARASPISPAAPSAISSPPTAAQGRATAERLANNGCPVRTMHIEKLDETSLGALLMHFMLETMIAAHLLGVDAFDQPAVEEGKVLAKQYLAAARADNSAVRKPSKAAGRRM